MRSPLRTRTHHGGHAALKDNRGFKGFGIPPRHSRGDVCAIGSNPEDFERRTAMMR
jgi:hypothetical protein